MPKADFSITLNFEGMPVQDDMDEDALARDIRGTAIDTARGAMCESWREAFDRAGLTVVNVTDIREESYDMFSVNVSMNLTGMVRVAQNGGSEFDEVREWAENIGARHIIPAGSVYVWGTEFTPDNDSIEVGVEHEGPWDENTSIQAVS